MRTLLVALSQVLLDIMHDWDTPVWGSATNHSATTKRPRTCCAVPLVKKSRSYCTSAGSTLLPPPPRRSGVSRGQQRGTEGAWPGCSVSSSRASPPHRRARGWTRPPCRHFKIQSCCCLGSTFEVAAFQTLAWAQARPPHQRLPPDMRIFLPASRVRSSTVTDAPASAANHAAVCNPTGELSDSARSGGVWVRGRSEARTMPAAPPPTTTTSTLLASGAWHEMCRRRDGSTARNTTGAGRILPYASVHGHSRSGAACNRSIDVSCWKKLRRRRTPSTLPRHPHATLRAHHRKNSRLQVYGLVEDHSSSSLSARSRKPLHGLPYGPAAHETHRRSRWSAAPRTGAASLPTRRARLAAAAPRCRRLVGLPATRSALGLSLALLLRPTPRAHHAVNGEAPPQERRCRHLETRHSLVC